MNSKIGRNVIGDSPSSSHVSELGMVSPPSNITTDVFFVVGAAKAGTTSLHHYLRQHPQIYLHPYKDALCFFCSKYGMNVTLNEFLRLLRPERNKNQFSVYGDVCSDYLGEPGAAGEIAQLFPLAKIMIVLRNPADRAFSLYQWMFKEGYEYLPTFEAAVASEAERLDRRFKDPDLIYPTTQAYLYFHSGLYSMQVKRYFDHFPRENILVLKYEDLVDNPEAFIKKAYSFLGVDPEFVPRIEVHNRGSWPLFPGFQYFFRRRLARYLPYKVASALLMVNASFPRKLSLDPGTRGDLLKKYEEDIRATEALTGLNLQSWLEGIE